MDGALRRIGAVVVVVTLVAGMAGPAAAITEDDLRDLRLELQEALGELETASWDRRIAVDNIGLVQYEYDALALDAEGARRDLAAGQDDASARSLALFVGRREGPWSDRNIADRYLRAALEADTAALDAGEVAIAELDAGLEFLATEIEQFLADEADALARVTEWEAKVAELDAAYGTLAAAYEVELQFLATSTTTTTSTTLPATTTTTTTPPSTTTTTPPPSTTTTTTPPSSTTTTTPPSSTTTTSPTGGTTTTVPPTTTTTTTTTVAPPSTTTTTIPPVPVGGLVCPVQGPHHFRDTWGAPRSGGRTHKGVDMMADRGTPLVAIEAGTVGRLRDGGLGGITVWLLGDSGTEYYYAHMNDWAPGLAQGQRIDIGGLLGTVGSTGNAPDAWPHLHFEIHPDGGNAVNPYPTVSTICP